MSFSSQKTDGFLSSIAARGVDATRSKWESHWANALSDADLDFLVNQAHCTSIRLPLGYYTLGPTYTGGTPFAGQPSQIYDNAWSAVLNLCNRLNSRGIGTLLDLHALPGGANGDAHSGTSSGKADLWGNRANLDLAKQCLIYMVNEVANGRVQGCLGIQLCNEAIYGASGMYEWYTDVINSIAQVETSVPLYISDAWDLNTALGWSININKPTSGNNPIVVDTHRYYTFSAADKARSPQQIISSIPNELNEIQSYSGSVIDKGAAEAFIGEWSCVLDGDTWAKAQGANRDDVVRQFGNIESQIWNQKSGGACFWTAKMDWMDGGEWGFFEMTKKGAAIPPQNLTLGADDVRGRIGRARDQRTDKRSQSSAQHSDYWDHQSPGQQFEHWRFENGWDVAFEDVLIFFGMRVDGGLAGGGGDKIGMLEIWIRKRLAESGQGGGFVWEWEQGFRRGVGDAYALLGI